MKPLQVLMIAGVLAAAAPRDSAACHWFGTQVECDGAGSRVTIGTQIDRNPAYAGELPLHPLTGGLRLPARLAVRRPPVDVRLQDFDGDPKRCEKIGNEIYCY